MAIGYTDHLGRIVIHPHLVPQTKPSYGFSRADRVVLHDSLRLLQAIELVEYRSVMFKLRAVALAPDRCPPGSQACTGGKNDRVAVFVTPPSELGVVETAVTLRHEAHHIRLYSDGSWDMLHHTCRDALCQDPWERKVDPIYARDEVVRANLQSALIAMERERRIYAMLEAQARYYVPRH